MEEFLMLNKTPRQLYKTSCFFIMNYVCQQMQNSSPYFLSHQFIFLFNVRKQS